MEMREIFREFSPDYVSESNTSYYSEEKVKKMLEKADKFTGLTDWMGQRLFVGDKVEVEGITRFWQGEIFLHHGTYSIQYEDGTADPLIDVFKNTRKIS